MSLLQEDASQPVVYYLLASIAGTHGNHRKAVELFQRAEAFGYNGAACQAQIARNLLAINQRVSALKHVEAAIKADTQDAITCDTIGVVLSRLGRHQDALRWYAQATQEAPDAPGYWYNYGVALQFIGDFDTARLAYDRVLRLAPGDSRARIARVTITKQTETENDVLALQEAWQKRDPANSESALQIGHALAKAYEDLGAYESALAALNQAKQQKKAQIQDRRGEDAACFAAAAQLATRLQISANPSAEGPVFICGMPRTGTTLVDRILTSHPELSSAGELSDFSVLLKRQVATPGAHVLDAATLQAAESAPLNAIGAAYLQRVSETLSLTGRFTDKMPLNIFFAPAILAALPNSKVICLRRHPADTMVSNYRQLFATAFSYYAYAYDLEHTAEYVVHFNQLIDQVEQTLPAERFQIVDYESILDAQEQETRRLLDFVGLEFDAACLAFETNQAPVATASSVQVRAPLYRTSLGRWKRYGNGLESGLMILREAGLIEERPTSDF